jgi:transcriptional regulator with XRE-family HTH domain
MENLGDAIRDERRKRKLTLERLSKKTNLSKSFLSQVERGLTQPSISSLKKIAQEFAINVVDLFGLEQQEKAHREPPVAVGKSTQAYVEDVKVVRANRRKSLTLPGSKVSYDLLTPDLKRLVEVIYLRTNPAESSGDEPVIDPPGEKFGVVLKGMLQVRIQDDIYELQSGDSIYFPAHFPHSWRGMGNEPISVIWVLTPPRF